MSKPKTIRHLLIMVVMFMVIEGCVTAEKCNKKFPSVTTTIIRDTTIFVPSTKVDTVVVAQPGDTIFLTDTITKIKVKFLKYSTGDTVFVSAQCPGDTIRVPVEVTTTTGFDIPIPEKKTPWWWIVLAIVAVAGSVGYLINSLKK